MRRHTLILLTMTALITWAQHSRADETTQGEISPDFNEAIDKAVSEDRSTPADDKLHQQASNSHHDRNPASKKHHKKGGGKSGAGKKKKKKHM